VLRSVQPSLEVLSTISASLQHLLRPIYRSFINCAHLSISVNNSSCTAMTIKDISRGLSGLVWCSRKQPVAGLSTSTPVYLSNPRSFLRFCCAMFVFVMLSCVFWCNNLHSLEISTSLNTTICGRFFSGDAAVSFGSSHVPTSPPNHSLKSSFVPLLREGPSCPPRMSHGSDIGCRESVCKVGRIRCFIAGFAGGLSTSPSFLGSYYMNPLIPYALVCSPPNCSSRLTIVNRFATFFSLCECPFPHTIASVCCQFNQVLLDSRPLQLGGDDGLCSDSLVYVVRSFGNEVANVSHPPLSGSTMSLLVVGGSGPSLDNEYSLFSGSKPIPFSLSLFPVMMNISRATATVTRNLHLSHRPSRLSLLLCNIILHNIRFSRLRSSISIRRVQFGFPFICFYFVPTTEIAGGVVGYLPKAGCSGAEVLGGGGCCRALVVAAVSDEKQRASLASGIQDTVLPINKLNTDTLSGNRAANNFIPKTTNAQQQSPSCYGDDGSELLLIQLLNKKDRLLPSLTANGGAATEDRGLLIGNSRLSKQPSHVVSVEMNVSGNCTQQTLPASYPVGEEILYAEGTLRQHLVVLKEEERCGREESYQYGYSLAMLHLSGGGCAILLSEKGEKMSVVLENMDDSIYEENRIGRVGSSTPCLDSNWKRGRVDSQRTKSGSTICEGGVEVDGHSDEVSEGTRDEEVRGESYEETELSDDDATEGVSLA